MKNETLKSFAIAVVAVVVGTFLTEMVKKQMAKKG